MLEIARQPLDGLKRQVALASFQLAEVFSADGQVLGHPFLGQATSLSDPADIATECPLQVAFYDFSLIVCYSLVYTLISSSHRKRARRRQPGGIGQVFTFGTKYDTISTTNQ